MKTNTTVTAAVTGLDSNTSPAGVTATAGAQRENAQSGGADRAPATALLLHGGSVAVFLGIQRSYLQGRRSLPLFNLTKPVGEYPAGATVSATTLERLGYSAPLPFEGGREAA